MDSTRPLMDDVTSEAHESYSLGCLTRKIHPIQNFEVSETSMVHVWDRQNATGCGRVVPLPKAGHCAARLKSTHFCMALRPEPFHTSHRILAPACFSWKTTYSQYCAVLQVWEVGFNSGLRTCSTIGPPQKYEGLMSALACVRRQITAKVVRRVDEAQNTSIKP